MDSHEHGFKLAGSVKRAIQEYKYFTSKNWTIKEVGDFWDSAAGYDDINEATYSYYRRFTNSWNLAKDFVKDNMIMLDIQGRTGKGTEFWFQNGTIKKSYLVDFSDFLLDISRKRLEGLNHVYELVKVLDYNLPFDNAFFDFVATYETIEHMGDPGSFTKEISRVLKPGGLIVLTCPNILWEPLHWLAAIFNIHHSEGPHNFLSRNKLLQLFNDNDLSVLKENTTVVLPFNNKTLISINEKLEEILPQNILRLIALRRSFVLRKSIESN
jgi:ubiquinone/menaquinone biosynthesis C-methylase UbiE